MKEKLKSKEKELCEIQRRFCECKEECKRLNGINRILETGLKNLNTKLADAKSSAVRAEERSTFERESLCKELQTKCKQLNDTVVRYNELKRNAYDQKCKCNNLFKALIEVNKLIGQSHYEMKNQVHKLRKEICMMEDNLCNMKNKAKELKQNNELNVMEINAQKNKVHERECQLKQMALISGKIIKITQKFDPCCNSKNKIVKPLPNAVCTEPKHCVKDIFCSPLRNTAFPKMPNNNICN